jgi:uncharacterized membrane protein
VKKIIILGLILLPVMSFAESNESEINWLLELDQILAGVESSQQETLNELIGLREDSLMLSQGLLRLENSYAEESRLWKAEVDTLELIVESQGEQLAALVTENRWLKIGLVVGGCLLVGYTVYDILNHQVTISSIYELITQNGF